MFVGRVCVVLLSIQLGHSALINLAPSSHRRKDAEDCFIVRLKHDVPLEKKQNAFNSLEGRDGGLYHKAINGFYKCFTKLDQIRKLADDPMVESIEEDMEVTTQYSQQVTSQYWNLDRVDQAPKFLNATFGYDYTGAGVYIYIVDTGVRATHEEFKGRISAGKDFVGDGVLPTTDCYGHGTHVAGIAAGTKSGVAKGAQIVPVRIMKCTGSGSYSALISALDWIRTQPKPGVINLSLGGSVSSTVNAAIDSTTLAGYHVTVAAGNNNGNACLMSPASATTAITTGSTDMWDTKSSFSNWGPCVKIFSPGSNIWSACNLTDTCYMAKWGTSMASPMVAGIVAAYLQANPAISAAGMLRYLQLVATSGALTLNAVNTTNLLVFSRGSIIGVMDVPMDPTMPDPGTPVIPSPDASPDISPQASPAPIAPTPAPAPGMCTINTGTSGCTPLNVIVVTAAKAGKVGWYIREQCPFTQVQQGTLENAQMYLTPLCLQPGVYTLVAQGSGNNGATVTVRLATSTTVLLNQQVGNGWSITFAVPAAGTAAGRRAGDASGLTGAASVGTSVGEKLSPLMWFGLLAAAFVCGAVVTVGGFHRQIFPQRKPAGDKDDDRKEMQLRKASSKGLLSTALTDFHFGGASTKVAFTEADTASDEEATVLQNVPTIRRRQSEQQQAQQPLIATSAESSSRIVTRRRPSDAMEGPLLRRGSAASPPAGDEP